jgi:membrane protease YdiL (CAAX protease family)
MLEIPEPEHRDPVWRGADFVAFAAFFLATVVFFPLAALYTIRVFRPGLRLADLTAVHQIVLQGLMDLVLVAFIMLLVKVRRRSFLETIHWHRQNLFTTGSLVTLGVVLAITVVLASTLFPMPTQTPIEKLISSTRSLYVFAIFGVAVAPLFEEIIFRGFLFKVFTDMAGASVAVSVTALLFALLHAFQLWGNWAAIGLIFAVGYALAFIRSRSGSLFPSLIVHTTYNAMLFGLYALGTLAQKAPK